MMSGAGRHAQDARICDGEITPTEAGRRNDYRPPIALILPMPGASAQMTGKHALPHARMISADAAISAVIGGSLRHVIVEDKTAIITGAREAGGYAIATSARSICAAYLRSACYR